MLKRRLDPGQREELWDWITSLAGQSPVTQFIAEIECWRFHLPSLPAQQAAGRSDSLWPMCLEFYNTDFATELVGGSYWSPEERQQVAAVLGWIPAEEIGVSANSKGRASHFLLAWMCAEISSRYGGLVDVGGEIPFVASENPSGTAPARGFVAAVPYVTASGVTAHTHIVDSEFLRDWQQRPNFYMIK
ncbi:MAG: hypothetical protein JWN34_3684 [Bryobacterales bacterium]|nr:hypothetical protein [Bryobacterales bacterium]